MLFPDNRRVTVRWIDLYAIGLFMSLGLAIDATIDGHSSWGKWFAAALFAFLIFRPRPKGEPENADSTEKKDE